MSKGGDEGTSFTTGGEGGNNFRGGGGLREEWYLLYGFVIGGTLLKRYQSEHKKRVHRKERGT